MAGKGRPRLRPWLNVSCASCGKQFEIPPYEADRKDHYCSRPCFYVGNRGKTRRKWGKREERKCERCGTTFIVGGTGGRMRVARFCSASCSNRNRAPLLNKIPDLSISPEDAAWLAGLFDGEGNICWPRRNRIHSIRISITNTYKPLLDEVHRITGTGLIRDHSKYKTSQKHSDSWVWFLSGAAALALLKLMLPRLFSKRHFAEVALGIIAATEPPWSQRTLTTRAAEASKAG